MASGEENDFRRTASAAAPESTAEQLGGESDGKISRGRGSVGINRGLPDIDLNVVPPGDDGGSESPVLEIDSEIESHLSEGEIAEEGKGGNILWWDALLEASSNALRDYEGKARNRRRGASREPETGELGKGAGRIRMRVNSNGPSLAELHAAPVVVARSTRGRAVAMPSKYKDSYLHAAAAVVVEEARSSRRRYR